MIRSCQVVIDAGAAIRLKRLERFGGELLTTSGVYAEAQSGKLVGKTKKRVLIVWDNHFEQSFPGANRNKRTCSLHFLTPERLLTYHLKIRWSRLSKPHHDISAMATPRYGTRMPRPC